MVEISLMNRLWIEEEKRLNGRGIFGKISRTIEPDPARGIARMRWRVWAALGEPAREIAGRPGMPFWCEHPIVHRALAFGGVWRAGKQKCESKSEKAGMLTRWGNFCTLTRHECRTLAIMPRNCPFSRFVAGFWGCVRWWKFFSRVWRWCGV